MVKLVVYTADMIESLAMGDDLPDIIPCRKERLLQKRCPSVVPNHKDGGSCGRSEVSDADIPHLAGRLFKECACRCYGRYFGKCLTVNLRESIANE